MALKKTQLLDITSVTGINTVGILTKGICHGNPKVMKIQWARILHTR